MTKYFLLLMLVIGVKTGYSQMIFDFEKKELKEHSAASNKKQKAREYAGAVYLKSGEMLEGNFFIANINGLNISGDIKMITFPERKDIKIEATSIEMINVYANDGKEPYTLTYGEYLRYSNTTLRKAPENGPEFKPGNKPTWRLQLVKGKASLYVSGTYFTFANRELIPFVEGPKNALPPFVYLGKIDGQDELPVIVHSGGKGGIKSYFRLALPIFFKGSEIAEKIKNKEEGFNYTENGNLERMFKLYNEGVN